MLVSFGLFAQSNFETKVDSFIAPMLNDYHFDEAGPINRYAALGATWSRRVDLKSNELFRNQYNQQDYQEYTLTFISFGSGEACDSARQEYLAHYSFKSGALTDSTHFIGRPPAFTLITDSAIIIFEVSCEGFEMDETWSWNIVKEKIMSTFGSSESESIENGCGGQAVWLNKRD